MLIVYDFLRKNGVQDVDFCSSGTLANIDGENYFFDSMWIPFLKPLNEFKEVDIDKYNEFRSLFDAIKGIINYLLNENCKIKLFFASVEDKELLIKEKTRIAFSAINEFRGLEWGTLYEIYK